MNYMKEVAKMLGVEIGERFRLYDEDREYNANYYFLEDGIYVDVADKPCRENVGLLFEIITGEYTIKRKPWKPKPHQQYWLVDENGFVAYDDWMNTSTDLNYYKLGNFYRTAEEAEANREKWKAFYESNEVLEV